MSRVLTRIVQIQGIVVGNIGRSNPLIRSQGGPGVAIASRSTGREVGAIALPFESHPKALSPQCLCNLLCLRKGRQKMGYSGQNPHGVPQASGLPWAGWRSCQMCGRSAALQPRLLRLDVPLRGRPHALRARNLLPPSWLLTIRCAPRRALHPGKPGARPCVA